MTSNFEFLRARWPDLCDHARRAEALLDQDRTSMAVTIRLLAERLCVELLRAKGLPEPAGGRQVDRLCLLRSNRILHPLILAKFEAIRAVGNSAAHEGESPSETGAPGLLLDAWTLAKHVVVLVAPETPLPDAFARPATGAQGQGPASDAMLVEPFQGVSQGRGARSDLEPSSKPPRLPLEEAATIRAESDRAVEGLRPEERRVATTVRLRDAFAGATLTKGQEEAIAALEAFFADREARVFLLKGHAGTGKTFLIRGIADWLATQPRALRLCAPTGRAARVIEQKAGHDAFTIHKAIYLFGGPVEYTDKGLDGSETFKRIGELVANTDPDNAVFLVDEASLVSDVYGEGEFFRSGSGKLLTDLLAYVNLDHNDHDKRLILVGDTAQLPPVGMAFSPALDAGYLRREHGLASREHEIEEVVRQRADSGVLRNVAPLRAALRADRFSKLAFDFDVQDVERIGAEDVLARYLDASEGAINGRAVVVTRTNAVAAEHNRMIRQHFFPDQRDVAPGDKLLIVANGQVDGVEVANGDLALVREAEGRVEARTVPLRRKHPDTGVVETVEVPLAFRDAVLRLRDPAGRSLTVRAKILETLLHSPDAALTSDQQRALYVDFCVRHPHLRATPDLFRNVLRSDPWFNALRVKFGYAVTCHKAQGGEWDDVFVVCPGAKKELSADNFRWLYTAMTRAKGRLWMVDPPRIEVGGDAVWVSHPPLRDPPGGCEEIEPAGPGLDRLDAPNRFGLTPADGLRFALLREVEALLEGSDVAVVDLVHNHWQEAYHLRRGVEAARVNLSYDKRGRVGVAPAGGDALAHLAARLLAPLHKRVLGGGSSAALEPGEATPVRFSQAFLDEYHARLAPRAEARGIWVAAVTEGQHHLRYSFARDAERAEVLVHYNGKGHITKCDPVGLPTGALMAEVADLLTTGMRA